MPQQPDKRVDLILQQLEELPTLPTVAWPIDAPFDKVYPDYPGGASIGGAANLAGVPGLFLPNGSGEANRFTARAHAPPTPPRQTRSRLNPVIARLWIVRLRAASGNSSPRAT